MKPRVVVTIPFTTYLAGALFSLPFRLLSAIVRLCVAVPIVRYACLAAALAAGVRVRYNDGVGMQLCAHASATQEKLLTANTSVT